MGKNIETWTLTLLFALGTVAQAAPTVRVFVTAKDGNQRLSEAGQLQWAPLAQPTENQACVFVDSSKTFQTLLGIGGALTDASAETYDKLPQASREEILKAYFDPVQGIGYSLGRTHINSCDFSSESYAYVKEGDKELASFDVAHDLKHRIPFIKAAQAISRNSSARALSEFPVLRWWRACRPPPSAIATDPRRWWS